jgi:3-oxoacyl-[acyl-carrier-protein] synthase II
LISCVQSLADQIVPQTVNLFVPDPECDLDYSPEGSRRCKIDHILKNSLAFGGSNAALVLSRYTH